MRGLLVPALVLAVGGCAAGSGQVSGPGSGIVKADVARAQTRVSDAGPAAQSVNGLGADLYRSLAATDRTGNLVVSPSSIAIALAMTRAGAVGATAAEMDAVLHVTDPAALARSMNALDQALASRSRTVQLSDQSTADVTLTQANSLWGQRGFAFVPAFLTTMAQEYGAGVRTVDYRSDPEAARVAINAWVAEQTKDRIRDLLAQGVIDTSTRLTLVNAIYLKAPWATPFAKERTADGPFTTVAGTTVTVPFMHSSDVLAYAKGTGWQAVELPYAGGDLSMVVVVPDRGGLPAVESALTADRIAEITAALKTAQVNLALPKWDTESKVSLARQLAALGMPTAFSGAADFSGMTTVEPLQIADVIHQANITVDEAGTEAAAATAVVMRATAVLGEQPVELTVDRPFLFALRDTATGAVLFLGRVASPAGS